MKKVRIYDRVGLGWWHAVTRTQAPKSLKLHVQEIRSMDRGFDGPVEFQYKPPTSSEIIIIIAI